MIEPLSRTNRYKKVTKPLLERKRRARINRCLDELKDLVVGLFEVEGDNVSKLEKADILELTVRHLSRLRAPDPDHDLRDPEEEIKTFRAGFGQCATEACQFIVGLPGVDHHISQTLVRHLQATLTDHYPGGPTTTTITTTTTTATTASPLPITQSIVTSTTPDKTDIINKIRERILERQNKEAEMRLPVIPVQPSLQRVPIIKDYRNIHPKKIMIRQPRYDEHAHQEYNHKRRRSNDDNNYDDDDDDNMWRPW